MRLHTKKSRTTLLITFTAGKTASFTKNETYVGGHTLVAAPDVSTGSLPKFLKLWKAYNCQFGAETVRLLAIKQAGSLFTTNCKIYRGYH